MTKMSLNVRVKEGSLKNGGDMVDGQEKTAFDDSWVDKLSSEQVNRELLRQTAMLNLLLRTLIPAIGRIEAVITAASATVRQVSTAIDGLRSTFQSIKQRM